MQWFHKVVWLIGTLALAGCSSFGRAPTPLAVYDLKPLAVEPVRVRVPITEMEVLAPSWLSSSAMQYRLESVSTLERRAFGNSRWAGMPAEMVNLVFARVVQAQTSASGSGCRLRIHLDEFIQRFTSAQTSVGFVEMRGSLLAPRTEALVAEKVFSVEVPAPSADAAGGVVALRRGVNQVAVDVAQWLDELARAGSGKRNVMAQCGK